MELRIKLICIENANKTKVTFNYLGKRTIEAAEKTIVTTFSKGFGKNGAIIRLLGLPLDSTINNGEFKVKKEWIPLLQPYFSANLSNTDHSYYIEFVYRKF